MPQPLASSALQGRRRARSATPATPMPLWPTWGEEEAGGAMGAGAGRGSEVFAGERGDCWGSEVIAGGCRVVRLPHQQAAPPPGPPAGHSPTARRPCPRSKHPTPPQRAAAAGLTAPMMPATWVPCPLSSACSARYAADTGSRLGARSGCSHCARGGAGRGGEAAHRMGEVRQPTVTKSAAAGWGPGLPRGGHAPPEKKQEHHNLATGGVNCRQAGSPSPLCR